MSTHESQSKREELVVVLSDIEMGATADVRDDFPQTEIFIDFLAAYNRPPFDNLDVSLVFNGDTFDFMRTQYLDGYPIHITKDIAMAKASRVASAHPKFFEALRAFLGTAKASRKIYFIIGNHDFELLFPAVQHFIISLCENSERVYFPGFGVDFGDVHIEHGSQHDPMFRLDHPKILVPYQGKEILNLPWATVAILETIMPMHKTFFQLDRLKPKAQVLNYLPELKDLIQNKFWNYYTKDFIKESFKTDDPLKRISWLMLKEVVKRFIYLRPDVSVGEAFQNQLRSFSTDTPRMTVIGHLHEQGLWSNGNRKLIQLGCFRNEFMIESVEDPIRLIPKPYLHFCLKNNRLTHSSLYEISEMNLPANYLPQSFSALSQFVHSQLASLKEREIANEKMTAQEKLEANRSVG